MDDLHRKMAPHAAGDNPAASKASLIQVHNTATAFVVSQSPFGAITDPLAVKGDAYTTPNTLINQAIYAVALKIFSYATPAHPNAVDAHINAWSQQFARANSFGVVPFYHQLQVRLGALNAILGYFAKRGTHGQPVLAVAAGLALTYMQPALQQASGAALPLALQVSALDVDAELGALVLNYVAPLAAARALGYPVVTPVNAHLAQEIQHLTVFNHFLAAATGRPSVHLFDGPNFVKTNTKFEKILAVPELALLYQDLLTLGGLLQGDDAVVQGIAHLNKLAHTNYTPFEYSGPTAPSSVVVVYGSHESTQVAGVLATHELIGVIKVRVPLPFLQQQFADALPKLAKKVVVLLPPGSALKADVTQSLFLTGRYHGVVISDFVYPQSQVWTPVTVAKTLEAALQVSPELVLPLVVPAAVDQEITANTSPVGNYVLWGSDRGLLVQTADRLGLSLQLDSSKQVLLRTTFDNGVAGGSFQGQLSSQPVGAVPVLVDAADVVLVDDALVLLSYDVIATAKPGATIIVGINKKTEIAAWVEKLPADFKKAVVANHNKLVVVDFTQVDELDKLDDSTKGSSADFLIQLAFWRAALPELNGFIVNKLLQANGSGFELLAVVLDKFISRVDEINALIDVPLLPEWFQEEEPKVEEEEKKEGELPEEEAGEEAITPELPFFPTETSLFSNPRDAPETEGEEVFTSSALAAAKRLVFSEAYDAKQELRPDLPVKNFVVKVQENRRLTPNEYSRNIFHIEFDTTGTDLKYEIGEALGVHGRNPADEVEKFLEFYGVDPNSVVEVTHRDDPLLVEVRSARQALTENVDFLGKPPKRFYELLAPFATNQKQQAHLEKLASAEGAAELKKRADVDFVTYWDLLEEFDSARPLFADLVKIIAPLKRREYSIALSQKIHPNAVHLLIVVVDWVDPKGRNRWGQCSKYLLDLAVGSEVVVLVKPSVMKLPPLTTQPIVMSGLGTGLAPFKAFIEEKVWQQQQGHEIGEIYLYMGSRHKKEEYLYGELWEAYKDAGLLTHIGAAFSRDQPQKIYIQDKIRDTIEDLTDAIVAKNGSFYLCGPTWPVPDITACLEDIVRNGAKREGKEIKDVAKVVEDMKEEGRYILEVY